MRQTLRRIAYRALKASTVLDRRCRRATEQGDGWATVLVFHGVSPDLPEDGVTITPDRFRSILEMLRRHYVVLSMDEVVHRIAQGGEFTGKEVSITFDDGYLNNYEYAVPLLVDAELPATFYLTAGYVGTEERFWWDREKGANSPLMSWAQAREMASLGLDIGCHTWSHPNLGVETLDAASRELLDSRRRIEDETGCAVKHFAYPFGGRENIRPGWIEAIRDAGYASNASADNGQVDRTTDRFLIPRLGAAPQRSTEALRINLDRAW